MARNLGKKVLAWGMVLVFTFLTAGGASALSEGRFGKFSNYQIYFYDPDAHKDCVEREDPGGEDPTPGPTEGWDGHCSNIDTYGSKIDKYFNSIYSIAQKNGLPWEGIVAQLIGESGFMSKEVCPFNPLGLKGSPSCDGKHRSFGSYDEAFNYYVNSIKPVREAMGKFKNDPYGYIDFLINGVPGYKYATDPEYVNKISGYVCGVQKWALAHGKPISGGGPNSQHTSGGSSTQQTSGGSSSKPYCREDPEDPNEPEPDPPKNIDGYVFPLQGATKSNYMHHSSLSPLPCGNLSKGGCHHDYWAMDLGLKTGTKTEKNYPDLIGKFEASKWTSVGVKVVAIADGKITSYKTYSRATNGYQSKCASVTYLTNDGRKFWLGHMSYDPKYKAGDTFRAGQVIGEVGPPPCAVGTQAHLHIDETPRYGSGGTVETVKLINKLYEALP